jgi:hypothetical protein
MPHAPDLWCRPLACISRSRRLARTTMRLLAPLILALVCGCGGSDLPPPVDPADAGRQLGATLEAWKKGEPYESLTAKDPPVVFNEPLWKDGTRLLGYEVGAVEMHGRQGRCTAKLNLQDKSGKQYERRIGYQIDTVPRIVIVREALGP